MMRQLELTDGIHQVPPLEVQLSGLLPSQEIESRSLLSIAPRLIKPRKLQGTLEEGEITT